MPSKTVADQFVETAALAHDGPMLVGAGVNRIELTPPPSVTPEMAKAFTLYMIKALIIGGANEAVDLARSKPWR